MQVKQLKIWEIRTNAFLGKGKAINCAYKELLRV